MPCGITFLGLSFVEVNPSDCSTRETVICASVQVAVYACISHLCEQTSPPD